VILDPATASIATGVPTRTIQRWVLTGRITDHGDGLTIRVNPDDVAELDAIRNTRKGRRLPNGNVVA
jgi:hypothetical protein